MNANCEQPNTQKNLFLCCANQKHSSSNLFSAKWASGLRFSIEPKDRYLLNKRHEIQFGLQQSPHLDTSPTGSSVETVNLKQKKKKPFQIDHITGLFDVFFVIGFLS